MKIIGHAQQHEGKCNKNLTQNKFIKKITFLCNFSILKFYHVIYKILRGQKKNWFIKKEVQ